MTDQSAPVLTHCENCGTSLAGRFCFHCGQPAVDYRRSFRHVIVDVLDSFLNWDSKVFATIAWLIARPWHLTNEFLRGRRVRYVHPLRLYLLTSILFFFAVTYWAKSIHLDASHLTPPDRADIEAELKKTDLPPKAQQLRDKMERLLESGSPSPEAGKTGEPSKGQNSSPTPDSKTEDISRREGDKTDQGDFGPLLQFGRDKPTSPLEKWIEDRAKDKLGQYGSRAPLFLVTVISNLPYMMLCCIPLFALVLEILYIRRRVLYIDHLVYALHIHSFAYLGIILIGVIAMGLNRSVPSPLAGWIIGLLWVAFVLQIFLSIRRVYRQGWFISIFKFFAGGFVYLIVLWLSLLATFFVTLAAP